VCELQLSQVEVDAFWSFVKKKSVPMLEQGRAGQAKWALVGDV